MLEALTDVMLFRGIPENIRSDNGPVNIPVTPKIAIRPVEFDYLLTCFGNALTGGNNNQSNFRYSAGIQFRF